MAVLGACTIEMGPPPDSDPALVPEAQRQAPPPPQPSEPQAWSRDLDFDGGERQFEREQLAEGLVAEDQPRTYSAERLTFESAQSSERPPTEAELIRERARQRLLEAQGRSGGAPAAPSIAPPRVAAAPVETVSAEALPPQGAGAAQEVPAAAAQAADDTAGGDGTAEPVEAAAKPARQRPSLPPPPTMPTQAPATQVAAVEPAPVPAPASQEQAAAPGSAQEAAPQPAPGPASGPASGPVSGIEPVPGPQAKLSPGAAGQNPTPVAPAATSAGPVSDAPADFWDAPPGTILVQISAIQDQAKVAGEWDRLKRGYPEVLGPLRLVVEEAKLGDRGVFFRVQAGGFASQVQAEDACTTLTARGQPCFVVERP
ncbi:SPOR domain-containing protein [Pelagibius sp.]|uniref:SPOR domain-containing protein n=1 Tax=Pelagibius sp. TaxID=1931238 RepID=UPI00261C33B9|nr:SPOR domain-containing protein [Pelagibius sp.]